MRYPPTLLLALLVAACGGDSGTNAPPPPPVASIQIIGTPRVKVGDQYQFSVEARTAEGTIVQRPVTWALDPGRGSISSSGSLVASTKGVSTIQATVEGVTATSQFTAYDWTPFASGATTGVGIDADIAITNKFGSSEFPSMVMGCVSGSFVLGIGTDHFVTASGAVVYSFDGGAPITSTWLETSDFSTLGFPGSTNLVRKAFATQMSQHARFAFSFGEFQGATHTTVFRVTGLAQHLATILAACPSNSLRANDAADLTPDDALRALLDLTTAHP